MGIQVAELTQGKQCYEKEFIDFEFNGKHISEFGMVAVFDGDRHTILASADFEDEVSQINGVSGQYYWGTHFKSLKKTFSLATDGMTEAQISAFKVHFQPGQYGKFIEDKLIGRYGYCRVAAVVDFNVIPFRKKKYINNISFDINEYKGDCKITFEWDVPFFYESENYIVGNAETLTTTDYKRAYNNGLPIFTDSPSIGISCVFGKQKENTRLISCGDKLNKDLITGICYYNPSTVITNLSITRDFNFQFSESNNGVLYFNEINDDINNNKKYYNSLWSTQLIELYPQSAITELKQINIFKYTNPNIIYQTNKAIQIVSNYTSNDIIELEELLRLEITHPAVIAWAAAALRAIKNNENFFIASTGELLYNTSTTIYWNQQAINSVNWQKYFNYFMIALFGKITSSQGIFYLTDSTATINYSENNSYITFNGEKNLTTFSYGYNTIGDEIIFQTTEEICGDMILTEYLKLDGGNSLTETLIPANVYMLDFSDDKNNYRELKYNYTYF